MYPFDGRVAWFIASRQLHLSEGLAPLAPLDSLLVDRLTSLRRWSRVRAVFTVLLSLGIIASVTSTITGLVQGFDVAGEVVSTAAAIAGAFTGITSVIYLLLTRILGQLEADTVALLGTMIAHNAN